MDTTINEAFPAANDRATVELFEQQQRELNRYVTRYVFVPFLDGICQQVPGGYVPAGLIHPIPAPKAKIDRRLLPDGAQILQVVSPSEGIPAPKSQAQHKDPDMQRLLDEVAALRAMSIAKGMEPPSVAIYLLETAPIVANITSIYGREGAVEITALRGMPDNAFAHYKINDLLFGSERPATLSALIKRMQAVIAQAQSQKSKPTEMLAKIASEIIVSARTCERFCKEHIRERHLQMEDPKDDNPKRYSIRDHRALDLAELPRRYEYMERQAEEQKQAQEAAAKREERLIEMVQERDDKLATVLGDMAKVLQSIPEAFKALVSKSGK